LVTLRQLIDGINVFGERWYTRIKGLGRERAGRIVRWIESYGPSLGTLSARATAPLRSVSRDVLFAERIPNGGVTPLEVMDVPHELSGSDGTNRALRERNQTGATDDLGAIRAWLALHESAPHTWRVYRTQAERILLWAVLEPGKPLSSLDVADITAYRSFLANVPEKWIGERRTPRWSQNWRPFAGSLSPSSRASAAAILKSMFQWLTDMRYLDFNAWTGVKVSSEEREATKIKAHHALTRAHCDFLFDHVERDAGTPAGERARFMLKLGIATGLRLSEMATATLGAMQPKWVDDELGTAWTLNVIGKRSKRRTVPMTRATMEALRRYLQSRGLHEEPEQNAPETPLIGRLDQEQAAPLENAGLALAFKKIFESAALTLSEHDRRAAARLANASTHWLRHTFGTRAVEA
jgi:site-specific recombinase XerD